MLGHDKLKGNKRRKVTHRHSVTHSTMWGKGAQKVGENAEGRNHISTDRRGNEKSLIENPLDCSNFYDLIS